MEMKHVKSTQIHSIGFDPETKTLGIRFWGKETKHGDRLPGTLYHYTNFMPEQFKLFSECESKGTYFGANIRGNKNHPHMRIDETK